MSTPHQPDDEGRIADTGMFKRFVEHEEQMDDARTPGGSKRGLWIAIGAIVIIIVIAVVIWLLTR